ncbi:MAG: cell division protein FtsZ [Sphingobacteriales bacterium]|nr:cell division protein FtsZ [Sphingobacteriales bacterium]
MIQFDLPKEQSSIIKVIGVGGGGSNAVNHMFSQHIEGVNFIICNTDAQAIAQSKVPNKIQLGPHLTQGLGAGANPNIGRQATEESLEEIKRILEVNTKMAFITAGMGGGTGTGGAPIIAKICKDLGILTVGIVTTPFAYEGKKRIAQAEEGISLLKSHVDTLLVISNDKLRHQFGNLKMKEAFGRADNVLATAAKCITDVINTTGQINVDFADVCTVMSKGGVAILGSAAAEGENRAQVAIENALTSPLLNDDDIRGAKWILININSAEGEHEFTMDEVEIIQNHLLAQAGDETDIILGLGYDSSLEAKIGITLIATGFERKEPFVNPATAAANAGEGKILMQLEMPTPVIATIPTTVTEIAEEIKDVNTISEAVANDAITEMETLEEPSTEKIILTLDTDVVDEVSATVSIQEEVVIVEPSIEINASVTVQEEMVEHLMMPTLVEEETVEPLSKNTVDKIPDTPQFFEISSAADQIPLTILDLGDFPINMPETKPAIEINQDSDQPDYNEAAGKSGALSSGRYLAKPLQIYAEELPVQQESNTKEEPLPLQPTAQEDEPVIDLQSAVNNSQKAAEEPVVQQAQPIMKSDVEEPALQDETAELRRRAAERIAKLRNLSFNINASDPNNEFETVPAYLRRNMDIHNQIADVESFYSNYTVKSNENNQIEISSINTFLDGKKPD